MRHHPPAFLRATLAASALAALLLVGAGCAARTEADAPAPPPIPIAPDSAPRVHAPWLPLEEPARTAMLERQFRGFDMAMVEVSRRYVELYWAVQDRNWAYADYQAEKIGTAIGRGLERRPPRAPSARIFLDGPLAGMRHALETGNEAAIATRMTGVTAGCNSCHTAERVPFITVRPPVERAGAVGR